MDRSVKMDFLDRISLLNITSKCLFLRFGCTDPFIVSSEESGEQSSRKWTGLRWETWWVKLFPLVSISCSSHLWPLQLYCRWTCGSIRYNVEWRWGPAGLYWPSEPCMSGFHHKALPLRTIHLTLQRLLQGCCFTKRCHISKRLSFSCSIRICSAVNSVHHVLNTC